MNKALSRPAHRSAIALMAAGLILLLTGSALTGFAPAQDQYLFDALRLSADNGFALLAAALSRVGGFAWLGPFACAVGLWLVWRKRRAEAFWLLLTIGSGRLMVEALKFGFEKARPPLADRLAVVTSYSFPSSHSAGSMLTAAALAMLFVNRNRFFLPPAIALACAVGWSRIALGVHWPSDVLAGLGLGMLWVGIAAHWLPVDRSEV